jgi:hypothetical protein
MVGLQNIPLYATGMSFTCDLFISLIDN